MRESKSPGPASASRGAKTPLRGVFRAGEIPAQFFIECPLRAAYMRPLQVNRKRDMASSCGPGMPGPYRGGDEKMGDGGKVRRGVGTPPYA